MKYIKKFESFEYKKEEVTKINETGEWPSDVDWEFLKNNRDLADTDEFVAGIQYIEDLCSNIEDFLPENFPFEIVDIKGFDNYQGAYARVKINGKEYSIWGTDVQGQVWIENYKFDNTSSDDTRGGLQGFPEFVAEKIIETEKI